MKCECPLMPLIFPGGIIFRYLHRFQDQHPVNGQGNRSQKEKKMDGTLAE